tara:strand:+ start:4049 stop:4435 length:387 start_codon:yes stop_codon:yes gene_type:complete
MIIKTYYNNKTIPSRFKKIHDFDKRSKESFDILYKYPDKIPVICERLSNDISELNRTKYLCPSNLTIANFMYVIRKRLSLPSEKSIYLFVNKKSFMPSSTTLSTIYNKHKDIDGFLYIGYDCESTFGS